MSDVIEKEMQEEEQADEFSLSTHFNLAECFKTDMPPLSYDIDPFLRSGGLSILGGEPGSKKTFLGLYMALCLIKGKPMFDLFSCKKKPILWLDFENSATVIFERTRDLIYGHFGSGEHSKEDTENFHFHCDPPVRLNEDKCIPFLTYWIGKTGAQVVFIDSFVGSFSGDENKSSDVRNVFHNLRDFMRQGVSFVMLHHTNKAQSRGMNALRGSSDFGGMAEVILMLKANKNFTNVTIEKHRHKGLDALAKWSFLLDDAILGKESNIIKLKYFERDPEEQDKLSQCVDDLKEWVQDTFTPGDTFRSGAALEKMKGIGGHKRSTVYDGFAELKREKVIKSSSTRGKWVVC